MGYVTDTIGAMLRLDGRNGGIVLREVLLEVVDQLIKCGALTKSGVVHLIDRLGRGGRQRTLIHLNDVIYIGKVATVGAVAIDDRRLVSHQLLDKERDDSSVSSVGILPTTEHVEVT